MRHRGSHLGRRSFALVLAYLLALQGILVAWGAMAAAAHATSGLAVTCAADGAQGPVQRSDDPLPCCHCGPLCGPGTGTALGAAPEAVPTAVKRPQVAAARWPLRPSDALPRISSDPRKARAPPAMA
ncbi:MAG: hypothetical protein GEU91_20740 [Rhizobiales bacterium]|nr:hypothetical protein [Hyphomicrobiales bacterium]